MAIKFYRVKVVTNLLLIFIIFSGIKLSGQSILEQKVNLKSQTTTVNKLLSAIESQIDLQFSFNPDKIPTDSVVQVKACYCTVSQVLKSVFNDRLKTKTIGNIVILKRNNSVKNKQPNEKVKIRGVITDKRTRKKIKDVTVYNAEDLKPVLTDSAGFFDVEIDKESTTALVIRRKDYIDTLIIIEPEQNEEPIEIELSRFEQIKAQLDSLLKRDIDSLKFVKWLLSKDLKLHARNFDNKLKEYPAQVSFVPGIGTHGKLSGASNVNFSFNVIGGYTGSVSGAEIGGVFNIVKHHSKGVQMAGFANIVGGTVNGTQMAGFTNITLDTVKGAQFAGFYNHASGITEGGQFAGFMNISKLKQKGIQAAGFANICPKEIESTQLAGFLNYGRNLKGVQMAGFSNITSSNSTGIQLAGFSNISGGKFKGMQISGFLNYAKKLEGVQLGFINVSTDSIKGVPIGFLSFAKNGYFRFQAEYSPVQPIRIGIKTGVRAFYNSIAVGYTFDNRYSVGYGLGTMINGKHLAWTFDVTADQLTTNFTNDLDLLTRFSTGPTYKIKRLELFGTININYHLFQDGPSINNSLFTTNQSNIKGEGFLNWSVGIRI